MPNLKSIISSINKALLSDYQQLQTQTSNRECNCRKKDQCPLEGKCLTQNVVYQATVTTETSSDSYVGLATNLKERYRNHTASFRHQSKRNETELLNTFDHSEKTTSLLPSSRETLSSADLATTLAKNVIYVFLRCL